MVDLLVQNLVMILGCLGMLAFMVSLIVQVTKDLPFIAKIPTKLYTVVISIVVSLCTLYVYTSYVSYTQIPPYYIVLTIFAALIVSYIAIYGWDSFDELYSRYTRSNLPTKSSDNAVVPQKDEIKNE